VQSYKILLDKNQNLCFRFKIAIAQRFKTVSLKDWCGLFG